MNSINIEIVCVAIALFSALLFIGIVLTRKKTREDKEHLEFERFMRRCFLPAPINKISPRPVIVLDEEDWKAFSSQKHNPNLRIDLLREAHERLKKRLDEGGM